MPVAAVDLGDRARRRALATTDGRERRVSNTYPFALPAPDMGDPPCYRDYCPACDRQVTVVDEECPACGTRLGGDE